MSVYDGAKGTAPSVKEIPPLLSGFFKREITARYNIEEDVVSVKPTRAPPSRPGWAAAAASATAAQASTATAGSSNGTYGSGVYGGGGGGYGGYAAPAAVATTGGFEGGDSGGSTPGVQAMAAPPLPPKPKPPSDPQAKVLYDYDPAGQEGMVPVSAGQVRVCLCVVMGEMMLFNRTCLVSCSWLSLCVPDCAGSERFCASSTCSYGNACHVSRERVAISISWSCPPSSFGVLYEIGLCLLLKKSTPHAGSTHNL